MNKTYDYVLRYSIGPGCCEKERLDALVEFCKASHTPEVMFFTMQEELNTGHATQEELEPWLNIIREGGRRLKEIGVRMSINPWMTLLHCDRGRKLKPGQTYQTMVDPYGNQASVCACPIDENWLDDLCACYSKFAGLNPEVLWIEDDFRLHNHAPLIWGGCFCDNHIKLYSKLAGRELTREEFAAGICAEGEPHPFRKIWLDVSRDTILHIAKRIAEAVFKVNPDIRLGLMCSDPATHCAEGRDWHALMDAMTGNNRPYVRIHLPAYSETTAQEYSINLQNVSRLVKAFLPEDIEIYPELENLPYSRFSKSPTFSAYQIESGIQLGAAGVTMNIYDMAGNGYLPVEGYHNMLARIRPFMDMSRTMNIHGSQPAGAEILVNPRSSYTLESYDSHSITGIYPRERSFSALLSAFSVANRYRLGKPSDGAVIAVSGQYFTACSDDEIVSLLKEHCAILDGEAVLTLHRRGLLHLIGAQSTEIVPACNGVASFEEVANGRAYYGIHRARLSMQMGAGDFLSIRYAEDTDMEVLTNAHSPEGACIAPAMTLISKRILILPYLHYPEYWACHRNTFRCILMQDALERMNGLTPTYAQDSPYLNVYQYENGSRKILSLVNSSGDDYDNISLMLDQAVAEGQHITLYSKDFLMGRNAKYSLSDRKILLQETIRRMETVFLVIE